ncbi:50S ribosomal protein L17 [Ereboglobus luteus]|uniref:Large ribosomal subunit protein bL17 n=1 Tax=Ereboglobus luteus TaxID=1796921 RepID=A0A2U8E2Q2_9BACT|nr:50S ribosomal protein L17 [Ereboglobus luteus]
MRHKVHKYGLGITREHRKAMMANMAASLIKHERIQTTLTKAKALRPFIEKVITKAKKAGVAKDKKDAIHLRRLALADVRDENAVTKLFNETYKQFADRSGGYTRIYKLGRRDSDAAEMALIEFVKADDPGYKKNKSRAKKAKKPAAAKPAAEEAAAPAEAPTPAAEEEKKD